MHGPGAPSTLSGRGCGRHPLHRPPPRPHVVRRAGGAAVSLSSFWESNPTSSFQMSACYFMCWTHTQVDFHFRIIKCSINGQSWPREPFLSCPSRRPREKSHPPWLQGAGVGQESRGGCLLAPLPNRVPLSLHSSARRCQGSSLRGEVALLLLGVVPLNSGAAEWEEGLGHLCVLSKTQ